MIQQSKKENLILFIHGFKGSKQTWEREGTEKSIYTHLCDDRDIVMNFDIEIFDYPTKLSNLWPLLYLASRLFKYKSKYEKNLPIERIAGILRSDLAAKFSGYKKIIFIAHSMGGLVTKAYLLNEIENGSDVSNNKFISLAVPHRGAAIANLGLKIFSRNPQLRQLVLYGQFTNELNTRWLRNSDKTPETWCFVAEHDRVVEDPDWQKIEKNDKKNFSFSHNHSSILTPVSPNDSVLLKIKQICEAISLENSNTKKGLDVNDPQYSRRLQDFLNQLKFFYDVTYQIREGCVLSEEALEVFPEELDIVRLWALFHNRIMEWGPVRETLKKIAASTKDEKIKAECLLAIFESYLNEFIRIRHHNSIEFEELREAKGKYLDVIPNKENIGKYYYFLSRYNEAEWSVIPNEEGRIASMNILRSAIKIIDKALALYPKKSGSGYAATYPTPWWLYCHKAMIYKIIDHEKFDESCDEFFKIMEKESQKKENILKKSIQIYAATYYLMKDDEKGLAVFLDDLTGRVTERIEELGLSNYEDSEVESYSYNHILMLFWKEKDQAVRTNYFSIMNKFQEKCPW